LLFTYHNHFKFKKIESDFWRKVADEKTKKITNLKYHYGPKYQIYDQFFIVFSSATSLKSMGLIHALYNPHQRPSRAEGWPFLPKVKPHFKVRKNLFEINHCQKHQTGFL
jgi:hypothetical protein